MLQASVPNVSSIFLMYLVSVFILMLRMFRTYVASVLSGCCIYFSMAFQVFLGVFTSVSYTYFKCFECFICLHTYVANVLSDLNVLKNISGVVVGTHLPQQACK